MIENGGFGGIPHFCVKNLEEGIGVFYNKKHEQ